ncbi:MAG TPA: Ig-like domain-containing protein, partial [Roseivirga sp.]
NWEGNDVRTSSRIFQGNNPRTGTASLNIIPTSTFSGEVWISLNLTGVTNPKITFYAYSKQNGSTSTRPALLNFSTSIDGGNEFLDDTAIGDETTFPNDNLTSYSLYEYELPVTASGEPNVIVRFIAKRGDGSGSAAELIIDDFTIEEQALPLAIDNVSTKDSNTVIVTFNQEVEQTSAETTENYAFTNGITISSATKTSANVVTLTTSTLVNNTYQLTVKNMKDVATNTASADLKENFNFIIPLSIESITVQDKNTILVDFNLNLNEASAETITNYSLNNSYGNPTSSTLNLTSPDQVSLVYSSVLTENNYALTIDNVTDNSGLAAANNLNGSFSYLPLAIQNVTVTSANTIELDFNQPLDAVSSQTASNYSVNFGKGAPTTAAQSLSDASKVTLNLATNLVNNTYEITINNVANNSGNATTNNLKANAQFSTATSTRQIVINEIFADPSGANQPNPIVLPNGTSEEFVELFNTTSESIDITGFQLAGGTIGNFVLDAGAYVTLTSTTNVTAYQGFGNVVGVSTWNTLTNSGEQLILLDNLGNQVDSLTYDLSWYHDNDKSDGGWTLEQVNPELICSDGNNWIASVSSQGGTPGKINSVYDNSPDITAPSIIDVIITNDQKIEVVFDETLDAGSIAGSKFILDNDVNINSANFDPPYWRIVSLSLNPALTSGTIYNLSISGLTDCAGNNINGASFKFLFDNESPVLQRIVYKSTNLIDLIFDEEVGKTVAETESNYSINQGIGNPSKATLNSTTPHRISLQMVSDLSLGSTYTLSYQNLTDSLGNTIALSNQNFVFINDIDTVIVVSNQLLDIYFDTDVDETSAEVLTNYQADDGLGSPISAARDNTNPKLVHLIFESAFPENTTTEIQFEDIQGSTLNYLQLLNTNFTYDTDDPDVDSVVVVDENTLRIYFDEVLDETSAETINNYSANNSIGIPTEAILQPDRT